MKGGLGEAHRPSGDPVFSPKVKGFGGDDRLEPPTSPREAQFSAQRLKDLVAKSASSCPPPLGRPSFQPKGYRIWDEKWPG